MVVFTYKDYCRCRKFLFTQVREDDSPYDYTYNDSIHNIHDVHDKLYRDFLYDSYEFSLFLRQFLNIKIDANSLIKYNNSFITENLKNRRSDVVFKLKNKPVYFFLEHQSSIDNSISYRILEYYYYLLKSTIDEKKIRSNNYVFPVIIPILLYTGTSNWKHIPNFANKQYYNVSRNHNYNFINTNRFNLKHSFVDIHKFSIEELLNFDSMVAYLLAIDKCKNNKELICILYSLCSIITDDYRKTKVKRLITYVLKDFLDEETKKALLDKLNERKDDDNMKYAWDYVREDIERQRIASERKGERKGEKRGEKKGILDTICSIVTKMLENGESIEKIQLYSGASVKEIEKIKSSLKSA